MTIFELGALGEFFGSIAVVVTLIYVAVQLRQNTSTVQAGAAQAWFESIGICILPLLQSKDLSETIVRGLPDSRNLTEQTWAQFIIWHMLTLNAVQLTYEAYKKNIVTQAMYESEMERAVSMLRWPGARQWWEAGGKRQISADFAAILDSKLEDDIRFTGLWWNKTDGFIQDDSQIYNTESGKETDIDS